MAFQFRMGRLPLCHLLNAIGIGDSAGMQHRTKTFLLALALAALLAATVATAAAEQPAPAPAPWQPTWFSAAQPVWGEDWALALGMPRTLRDVTLRQSLRSSLGGTRVRLVVSNEYGSAPLTLGAAALRGAGAASARAVRFQGQDGTVVAPGARAVSDPLDLSVAAGDRLEVDLHLPEASATAGFHWDAQEQTLLLQGNAVGRREAPTHQTLHTRAFVSGLWVDTGHAPATVVAFGDSITDGNGSSFGQDQRWPDHLARRLAPRGVAVLNAGIAGNRLLRGGWGESALARLERDVLGHPGVRALEGTPLQGHHSPQKETLRQALNAWIRHAGAFDAVVDFDAVLRDPARPARLAPALDSGDHLHPGDAGYRRMAEAIDLDALLGTSAERAGP
jgi:lysophospholipase L1-like esterase